MKNLFLSAILAAALPAAAGIVSDVSDGAPASGWGRWDGKLVALPLGATTDSMNLCLAGSGRMIVNTTVYRAGERSWLFITAAPEDAERMRRCMRGVR